MIPETRQTSSNKAQGILNSFRKAARSRTTDLERLNGLGFWVPLCAMSGRRTRCGRARSTGVEVTLDAARSLPAISILNGGRRIALAGLRDEDVPRSKVGMRHANETVSYSDMVSSVETDIAQTLTCSLS